MRYFVQFSYKGTDFHGSQTQPNGVTVQEVMEQAFATLLRRPVPMVFAGRTDAGVHAQDMWAHLDWDGETLPMDLSQLTARLNNLLPASIALRQVVPVRNDAHARYSALSRTYEYRVVLSKDPFCNGLYTRISPKQDWAAMNRAALSLIGKHDFASFCKVHTDVKTTFCTVTEAQWKVQDEHKAVFTIRADRFLRNMVRAVVGTLLQVGQHKMDVTDFGSVIAARNRCSAGQSAPPEGLYLTRVEYPQDLFI